MADTTNYSNSYTEEATRQQQLTNTGTLSLRKTIKDLQTKQSETLWPDEAGWVQFVKDHYNDIKAHSYIAYLDPNDTDVYAYSLETYLYKGNRPRSMAWIVAWLNQFDSSLHFDRNLYSIMIPDTTYMMNLKRAYITTRVVYEKALGTRDL